MQHLKSDKVAPMSKHHDMKIMSKAPRILDHDTRWEWSVSFSGRFTPRKELTNMTDISEMLY
jgi:hypothetical protein